MALFKEVRKPVIKHSASDSTGAGSLRPTFVAKTAPCIQSCPSGTDVRGWLVALAQHKAFDRTPPQALELAWRMILEHNPFPAICGRVCQHPCELNCNRKAKDGPLAVRELERFVGDFGIAQKLRVTPPKHSNSDAPRIAIVGAGPAGLSAAYHLARRGHAVKVFDAAPQAGGMMRYRIPRSVLPSHVLDAEIENILFLGVELQTDCAVGRDISLVELQRTYGVVFYAMGLQKAEQLELRSGCNGEAATIGALASNLPGIPPEETAETEPKVLNTVSVAIAQGRVVAEAIAAFLAGDRTSTSSSSAIIRSQNLKLDWYQATPRVKVTAPMTEADVIAEAARCMSCGMCMDCETCWMYCSKNCFTKLQKGEHYKLKLDLCNGCGKCAESCPCGYIQMN